MSIVNIAALNIGVHVSFGIVVLTRYMPTSGVAGSKAILWACLNKSIVVLFIDKSEGKR